MSHPRSGRTEPNAFGFHPAVEAWISRRFGGPTAIQERAWPLITGGRDVLLTAPTGSGKTLAAFLKSLDGLVRKASAGELEAETHVVYISPLKALSNDVQRNLEQPIRDIEGIASELGYRLSSPIRTMVRTGDTPEYERRKAARVFPHVLVTTPESLFILLTSVSGRKMLGSVRTVIVDEIHAVLDDKRGAHLALSLERLDALVRNSTGSLPQRIGLSATVEPMSVAARFLVGNGRALPEVADTGRARELDLRIEAPESELSSVCTNEHWGEIYDRLTELIREHRSTIVFVNTRRLVERVSHQLTERLGEGAVAAHHGSLSRTRRLDAERRLESGSLRAIVATASLELGIDVGAVDLTCLIGSPRSIATALQRVGRSGHALSAIPKGRFFPLTRDQLIETAAIIRAARRGILDELALRDAPLDILSAQIVALAACEEQDEDALFELVRRAAPYANLGRGDFESVLAMLSEGTATRRGRAGALIHRDQVGRKLRGRRGARLAAITSGGAIPDNADFDVVLEPEGVKIGTLDEDFAVESLAGDVFLLGNDSWRVRRVENGRVRVEDAHGAAPSIPFWLGEAPARTRELSFSVAELRERVASLLDEDIERALAFLEEECALDRGGAEVVCAYIQSGRAALGAIPTQKTVIAERFFDESMGMQLVLHTPFGGRINRALGLALRKRFCRSFDFELQAAATDDGVLLSLGPQHSFPLESIFDMTRPSTVIDVLEQAILQAPMFGTRFRWNASRSLALPRFRGGKRVPPILQRMRSDDLLAAIFPAQQGCQDNRGADEPIVIPEHPLVRETMRDCMTEAMDAAGLVDLLSRIQSGDIRTIARDLPEPSVFAHEILSANPYAFLDDAPLEERRARAVSVRRGLPIEVASREGGLDPKAIEAVCEEARPTIRDEDELHDFLLDVSLWPEAHPFTDTLTPLFGALVSSKRAARLVQGERQAWVAAERLSIAKAVWPSARVSPPIQAPAGSRGALPISREDALVDVLRGWLTYLGPITAAGLSALLRAPEDEIDIALHRIEGEGEILRGQFSPGLERGTIEWCDRRLLARIHRRTVASLRAEIEPVTVAELLRFLFVWQGLRTKTHGREGLSRIIAQLQGFEAAAGAWESEILPARIANYEPALLDALCLSGEVVWGRLALREAAKGVSPGRSAPIALMQRRDLGWLLGGREDGEVDALSHPARDALRYLQSSGASFTDEIVSGTRRLACEIEDALGELVASGWVTGDGFSGLRALLTPASKRSRGVGKRINRHRREGTSLLSRGRWALLKPPPRLDTLSESLREEARIERLARQYLERYGVVFREVLHREPASVPYRELLRVFRRLELRGEVRGGRIVAGFVGEQFATPEALDALRTVRREGQRGEVVRVSACDPLNWVGILTPGPRVPAKLGHFIVYRDGVAEAASEEPRKTPKPRAGLAFLTLRRK